jgi:hypothetical protein
MFVLNETGGQKHGAAIDHALAAVHQSVVLSNMVNSYRTLLADGTITASGRPQSGNSRNRIDTGAAAAGKQGVAHRRAFFRQPGYYCVNTTHLIG